MTDEQAAVSAPPRRPPPPPPPPPADELGLPTAPSVVASTRVSSPAPVGAGLAPAQAPAKAPTRGAPTPATPEVRQVLPPRVATPVAIEPEEQRVDLRPELLLFILADRYGASNERIKETFKLSPEDAVFIGDLDRLVMAKQLDLESYLATLEEQFKSLPVEQRDALYAQLLADRFVPLGDYLDPSAETVARNEQLKLPKTDYYRVYLKPMSYSVAATEIAAASGFAMMGGPVRERLRDLIASKVKGVRVDAEVRDMLTRGLDFGGIGLDAKTADLALNVMNDILSRAKVMSEQEYGNWLANRGARNTEPGASTSDASRSAFNAPSPPQGSADDQEIAEIKKHMEQPSPSMATALDRAIQATLERVTYHPTDDYLAKRLRNVISSRLRDVRSAIDFRQLLMRDTKVGGLGLSSADADTLAREIESSYQEFHGGIASEEKKLVDVQLEEQKRKVEARKRQEAEEHAKWYEERIRNRKAGEAERTQAFEVMRKVSATGPTTPLDLKEQTMETAKFGPLVQAAPGVKVSPPTAELANAKTPERPMLDAMSYAGPKLMGLLGELRSISLAEFRRTSKDPKLAASRVLEYLDNLGHESFEKRAEGIKAFRESPLQASYMALVGESFKTGKQVVSLAEEKRKAGQDTLSPDEIAAVVELNSKLHY